MIIKNIFQNLSTKDLLINLFAIGLIIFVIIHFLYDKISKFSFKKTENFDNNLGNCIDIYPKWARSKSPQYFEDKYPECFTEENYEKIKEELSKTFKKIIKHNIPMEMLCSILNSIIKKDLNNKAGDLLHETFPKCADLNNFNVDQFVNKVLARNSEENFQNMEDKTFNFDIKGLELDMNQILNILSKKYPEKDLSNLELSFTDKLEEPIEEKKPEKLSKIELLQMKDISNLDYQQYKIWLDLYKENPEKLSSVHIKNLQKIINDKELLLKDFPKKKQRTNLFTNFIIKENLDNIIQIEKDKVDTCFNAIDLNKSAEYIDKLSYINFDKNDNNLYQKYQDDYEPNPNKKDAFKLDKLLLPKI